MLSPIRSFLVRLSVLLFVALLPVSARAAIALNGVSPLEALTSGGTVISFTPFGSFTSLTASVDGIPVILMTNPQGPTRVFSAPPHAAGSATLMVIDSADSSNVGTATINYVTPLLAGEGTPISRVSLRSDLTEVTIRGGSGSGSSGGIASGDGRYVAFFSDSDFGFGAPNTGQRFYRFDRQTNELLSFFCGDCRASLSLDGSRVAIETFSIGGAASAFALDAPFNGPQLPIASSVSSKPNLSGNGQFVVFTSTANLDSNPSDTANTSDLFVRDLSNGVTTRYTTSRNIQTDFAASAAGPSISADGRYVVFSTSDQLVNDSNAFSDIYLLDRTLSAGSNLRALTAPIANAASTVGMISANGATVAFTSAANNLVAGASDGFNDIFVMDLPEGSIRQVSVRSDGVFANGASTLVGISGNGRRVSFVANASNLTRATSGIGPIFVHDRTTGQTLMEYADANGVVGDGFNSTALVVPNGRELLINSLASNLVPFDTNALSDVFAKTLPPDVPSGSSIRAYPFDPATGQTPGSLQFATVTNAGNISVTTSASNNVALPANFTAATPYYDFTTTAALTGAIEVCVSYADGVVGVESALRLMYLQGGTWADVTTSADTTKKIVCGAVSALSPFVIANPAPGYLNASAPTIALVSPNAGTAAGGTPVTIFGGNYAAGATVMFGSSAGQVTSVAAGTITVTTPAHVAGPFTVIVTNPDHQSATGLFTFVAAATPTIASLSPNAGASSGGTMVTVGGTGFQTGATVTLVGDATTNFAGVAATVNSVSPTQIKITTPPHAPAFVNPVVRNPDLQVATTTLSFTYKAPPIVSVVTPSVGSPSVTNNVTITGQNFSGQGIGGPGSVTFGGVNATNIVVVNDTTITARTATASVSGSVDVPVDVAITGTGGTATLTGGFTYQLTPAISTVSPPNGAAAGGSTVIIRGANFFPDASVTFGGIPAPSVQFVDATEIVAVTPLHAVAIVDVRVNTAAGSRHATATNAYTFGPVTPVGAFGAVQRVSARSDGSQLAAAAANSVFAADGQYVAFITNDPLLSGDSNGRADLYVRNLTTGAVEQVNVTTPGNVPGAGATGPSGSIAISHDGRFIAFITPEALDPSDTNNAMDMYLRDRQLGTTERVSLTSAGGQIAAGVIAQGAAVSADGRFAAFLATGTGVTVNDTNAVADVFVRDRGVLGSTPATTVMMSVSSTGAPSNGSSSFVSMSANGRFVAFGVAASNFGWTKNAAGAAGDIVIHDRDADQNGVFDETVAGATSTSLVSKSVTVSGGGNALSTIGGMSADGRYIVFQSTASDLVANDSAGLQDVFVYDRLNIGTSVTRISVGPGGAEANGVSSVGAGGNSPFSGDGRFVGFISSASNLVPFHTATADMFVYDQSLHALTLVSADENGGRMDWGGNPIAPPSASVPAVSTDGTEFFFASTSVNLVPDDTNSVTDLFLKTLRPNTPASPEPVQAAPVDLSTGGSPATLEFPSVSSGGTTTLQPLASPPAQLPGGFSVGTLTYEIATTATIPAGSTIEVCISYAGFDVGNESALRMMHFDSPVNDWVDITTRVDTAQKVVCGNTTSLSPFTIAKPTPTAVTVSATASTFGGTTTLSAVVSPTGVPGSVSFHVNGGSQLAAMYVPATGEATLANYTHNLPASDTAYAVEADFEPTVTNYAGSEKTDFVLGVSRAFATVTFTADTLNQQYDRTMKTVGTSTTPAGLAVNVTFTGTPADVGSYPVTATIVDANYQGTQSDTLVVAARPATITTANSGKVFGTADPSPLTTAGLSGFIVADGISGTTLSRAIGETVGSYAITATPLDPNGRLANYAVTNLGASFVISRASATITFGPAPTPAYLGADFVVSAATSNTDSAALTFTRLSGPCALVSGATFRSTGAGPCVVQASGAATANFSASSANLSITIDQAATTTDVTSNANPSSSGQSVTVTATVTAGATAVDSGAITFKENGVDLAGPVSVGAAGKASFSTSLLSAGPHTITAQYSGTTNFLASTGNFVQTVSQATTTYSFTGFYQPIDMPVTGQIIWNSADAGRTIPVKWTLAVGGVPVSNPTSFAGLVSTPVNCSSGLGSSDETIEQYVGGSGLQYLGNGNWQYNWAVPKNYANTCRVMSVKFSDGSTSPAANFKFK